MLAWKSVQLFEVCNTTFDDWKHSPLLKVCQNRKSLLIVYFKNSYSFKLFWYFTSFLNWFTAERFIIFSYVKLSPSYVPNISNPNFIALDGKFLSNYKLSLYTHIWHTCSWGRCMNWSFITAIFFRLVLMTKDSRCPITELMFLPNEQCRNIWDCFMHYDPQRCHRQQKR